MGEGEGEGEGEGVSWEGEVVRCGGGSLWFFLKEWGRRERERERAGMGVFWPELEPEPEPETENALGVLLPLG